MPECPVILLASFSGKEESKDEKSSEAGSEQSYETSKGKKKKRVSWAPEKSLLSYRYFELDDTERGRLHVQCTPPPPAENEVRS